MVVYVLLEIPGKLLVKIFPPPPPQKKKKKKEQALGLK
jgi:hypothetical protein